MKKQLVVIVGPTASGKSELGIKLAREFRGEIVSADSRQVYRGLNVGTAKPTKKERQGVPHYLIDVVSPKLKYTIAHYQKAARKTIAGIQKRGKLPFLVGGSPLYVYAVIDGWVLPEVPPNAKLRKQLEELSLKELFKRLQKQDPRRAKAIESKNRRRLIRALEIIEVTGEPVPPLKKTLLPYPVLFLGVRKTPAQLKHRIKKRFLSMLKRGFLKEVKDLRKQRLSWRKIERFGLEYREGARYLQGKMSKQEMTEHAVKATKELARRQMAWFQKDPRIHWVKSAKEAESLVRSKIISTKTQG